MRFRWRRLESSDPDVEFVFGVLFLSTAFVAAWVVTHLPVPFPLYCYFSHHTGIPCPACGSFRCLQHLLAADLRGAFLLQPLATILALLAVAFWIYAWGVVICRLPRLRLEGVTRGWKWLFATAGITAVLLNWTYLWVSLRP